MFSDVCTLALSVSDGESAVNAEMREGEVITCGFFGKSVMSNDVLLGHTGKRMF